MLDILFLFIYIALALGYIMVFVFIWYSIVAMVSAAPFVPSNKKNVETIIRLAELQSGMKLLDLGSGDGRIVFRAAEVDGVYAKGIEINPLLTRFSEWKRKRHPKMTYISFSKADLWNEPLHDVDVLTLFFIHTKMKKLAKKIKNEMKPGAIVISNTFRFPKDWKPAKKDGSIYVYIV